MSECRELPCLFPREQLARLLIPQVVAGALSVDMESV